MFQFLECGRQIRHGSAPWIQTPHQHDVDFPPPRRFQQFFSCFPLRRTGANLTNLQRARSSNHDGQHTRAGPDFASRESADHSWKCGHTGQHETFSAVCVAGQKRGRIWLSRMPRLARTSSGLFRLAAVDPFRPGSIQHTYAASLRATRDDENGLIRAFSRQRGHFYFASTALRPRLTSRFDARYHTDA
jgi:hypothetical protein